MNLRLIRKKIRTVSNVKKITKAMEMISAIKMKKSQNIALDGRPYNDWLKNIILKVVPNLENQLSPLLKEPIRTEISKSLSIVISSNKGLCGGFNINLFRFISKNTDFKNTDFLIIGKKASFLSKLGGNIIADFSSPNPLNNVSAIYNFVLNKYLNENYFEINIFYNKFISILKSEPTKTKILPLKIDFYERETTVKEYKHYLIEPSPEKIIDRVLNSYLQQIIQNAIIESEASEHSSRMMAMKNANENANDVIYNLTMLRNKVRQQNITYELLDMVSAKQSVE